MGSKRWRFKRCEAFCDGTTRRRETPKFLHFCGAERIKGYHAEEIIGERFSRFYTQEDQREGVPMRALARFKPVPAPPQRGSLNLFAMGGGAERSQAKPYCSETRATVSKADAPANAKSAARPLTKGSGSGRSSSGAASISRKSRFIRSWSSSSRLCRSTFQPEGQRVTPGGLHEERRQELPPKDAPGKFSCYSFDGSGERSARVAEGLPKPAGLGNPS